MIIPLGHEQTSVRRLPWVTFGIMALCTLILVVISPSEHQNQMVSFVRLHQALGYFTQHPYLELDPRFQRIFVRDLGEDKAAAFADSMRSSGPRPPRDSERLQREQRRLDGLIEAYYGGLESSVLYRFGFVPTRFRASDLVTYAFLHTGWFHLFFNLLMLFVIAPFIEDVWGRPIFAGFYLAAAAFAALMFAARYPDVSVPLVGASGAIAGVMGAFLVRYLRSRLRFAIWLFVPIGPFSAPAWIVLPLWFLIQLLSAQHMDATLPEGGGGAVAFWAHVWGFAFGVLAALAMGYFRVEERYIDSAIERKVTLLDNPKVEAALARGRAGDVEGALTALEEELAADPDNVDAAMAAWNLSVDHGRAASAAEPMLRAILNAVRSGDRRFVVSHWEEMLTHIPDVEVDPLTAVRIAELLEQEQRVAWAIETLDLGLQGVDETTPAAVLLRMARMSLALEDPNAEDLVRRTMDHPDLPPNARPELEVALWALSRQRESGSPQRNLPHGDGGRERQADRGLRLSAIEAVPLGIDEVRLTFDCRGRVEEVDLRSVKAVAAAVLARSGSRTAGIVDLLLEVKPGQDPVARTIRIRTDSFDPRTLFEASDPLEALGMLTSHILEVSSAVPLPDGNAARGQPFRAYPDLEAYERAVLGSRRSSAASHDAMFPS